MSDEVSEEDIEIARADSLADLVGRIEDEAYVPVSGLTHRHPEGDGWREHNHLAGGVPHQHDPETGFQIPVEG